MRKQEIKNWDKNELLVATYDLLYDDAFVDFKKEVERQMGDGNIYAHPDLKVVVNKTISYEYLRHEIGNNRKINSNLICCSNEVPADKLVYYIDADDFSGYITMLHDYIARSLMLIWLVKGGMICDNFSVAIEDFDNLPSYWFEVMLEVKASPREHGLFNISIFENFIHEFEEKYYDKIDSGLPVYTSIMCMLDDMKSNLCIVFPVFSDCISNLIEKSSKLIKYSIENCIQCETL